MSASYQSVLWNRQKRIYDLTMAGLILLYLILFMGITTLRHPEVTEETLIIRATATLAILLLHIILAIGPLARLQPAFLPLLYNRRHLGVTMFTIAAIHGVFSTLQFHSLGNINPVLSIFQSNTHYASLSRFPFQVFGFFALVILFLMAISSHDFWLHNLGPRFWKTMHMGVYLAYALVVLHVMLGVLQYETSPVFVAMLAAGLASVVTLHLLAGRRTHRDDRPVAVSSPDKYVLAGALKDIPEKRAKIVALDSERVAIFRYDGKLSAVSNVCKHQNGPLGEGQIVDGCITCPWHGYQYLPHNGTSPPPFTEKVATYDVKLIGDQIWINPIPYSEGTERPPAVIANDKPQQ